MLKLVDRDIGLLVALVVDLLSRLTSALVFPGELKRKPSRAHIFQVAQQELLALLPLGGPVISRIEPRELAEEGLHLVNIEVRERRIERGGRVLKFGGVGFCSALHESGEHGDVERNVPDFCTTAATASSSVTSRNLIPRKTRRLFSPSVTCTTSPSLSYWTDRISGSAAMCSWSCVACVRERLKWRARRSGRTSDSRGAESVKVSCCCCCWTAAAAAKVQNERATRESFIPAELR